MIQALALAVLLIKGFEGCRLKAYQDIVGVWTIGYGETLGVVEGMVWTQEQADARLTQRVGHFLLGVLKACPALHLFSPEKLAACVSLAYNIGLGGFYASAVRSRTMRQEFVTAAQAFLRWNKAGGIIRKGLTIRRRIESARYLSR